MLGNLKSWMLKEQRKHDFLKLIFKAHPHPCHSTPIRECKHCNEQGSLTCWISDMWVRSYRKKMTEVVGEGGRSSGFKCYKVTGHALPLCLRARVHPLRVPWRAQHSFRGNVPDRTDYSPFFILYAQLRKPSLPMPSRPLSLNSVYQTDGATTISSEFVKLKSSARAISSIEGQQQNI